MFFRRSLLALLALPVLVLLTVTGFWFVAINRLESGFEAELVAARGAGWTVNAAPPKRGGWPLAAKLTVPGIAVSGAAAAVPVPIAWGAERLVLRVTLARPGLLTATAEGAERLRLGDGPELPVGADAVRVLIPLGADTRPELQAINLRIGKPGSASPDGGLTVSSLTAHGASAADAARFDLDAVTIGLPSAAAGQPGPGQSGPGRSGPWLFGPRIASLSMAGVLHGPFPAAGAAPLSPAQVATAWRDGGGTLAIERLGLDWGALKLSGTGTLGLDRDLQPTGDATLLVPDYAGVIGALAEAGRIAAPAALAAKAVIGLIARGSDQESGGVALPVTLRDQTLALGQIPLARMPRFVWPAG